MRKLNYCLLSSLRVDYKFGAEERVITVVD
jgi:hypothetical protein